MLEKLVGLGKKGAEPSTSTEGRTLLEKLVGLGKEGAEPSTSSEGRTLAVGNQNIDTPKQKGLEPVTHPANTDFSQVPRWELEDIYVNGGMTSREFLVEVERRGTEAYNNRYKPYWEQATPFNRIRRLLGSRSFPIFTRRR